MEERLIINGGRKLSGVVSVEGSKNAFLPILAGCVLCFGEIELKNYVDLTDLVAMREILQTLGISSSGVGDKLFINTSNIKNAKITHELTQKVRASIFILGAVLGRFRSAVIAYPGGCKIGERPIDIHLNGFKTLGAKIVERHGYIYCHGENLKAGEVVLDFPSVGATESLMMCAVLLKGRTVLKNCAQEPEVEELQNFLNAMGAKIYGAGTGTIVIDGVEKLHGGSFEVMSDRIVAGTYLLATAICGGDVVIESANFRHNKSLISFLKQTACKIEIHNDKIRLRANKRLSSISKIETLPYPLFPTDLQPQMMVLQSVCKGTCFLTENLFENRFGHVVELKKMGADITLKGRSALIRGVEKLYGADVFSSDLRAGAALVLAGMCAEGYTTVHNINFIDRGYEKIEEKYRLLGADIKRV